MLRMGLFFIRVFTNVENTCSIEFHLIKYFDTILSKKGPKTNKQNKPPKKKKKNRKNVLLHSVTS